MDQESTDTETNFFVLNDFRLLITMGMISVFLIVISFVFSPDIFLVC